MKLEFNESIVYIADDSPEAIEILKGRNYKMVNGKLIVYDDENKVNKYKIAKMIKNAKTLDELKEILIKLILI